jgi:hypothetical protein
VRLWYVTDVWHSVDFQYLTGGVPAVVAPVPGSQLGGDTETFQWSANGSVVTEWTLSVGSSQGANDLYDSGALGSGTLSDTVSGLPMDGSTVWVRLWYTIDQLRWVDYQYTAMLIGDPEMVSPTPGSQLGGDTETFQWSANGTPVTEWCLYVGTSVGGKEIHDSGSLGSSTLSAVVSGLPSDGSTVWVRLWYVSNNWRWVDFQYTATTDGLVRDYNLVVDQLIEENSLELNPDEPTGTLFVAPDFYFHFLGTGLDSEGKSPKFFDWLHPDGIGYPDMADLWEQSLVP